MTPHQDRAVAPAGDSWPLNPDGSMYNIADIYPTIQGEGRQAGTPMTIVRLQGCPVGCVFCDTPETWGPTSGRWASVSDVVDQVARFSPRWALITGGEPAWHDLTRLTSELRQRGLKTALETSGVYAITGTWNWVTVSPKPRGHMPFRPDAMAWANEVKWIVGRRQDVRELEELTTQSWATTPPRQDLAISLQPVSCSLKAVHMCLDALTAHPEWFLSLQTHKYIGVP